MKLRKPHVDSLARKMAEKLATLPIVKLHADVKDVQYHIAEAMLDNMAAEDEIEEEAHKLIATALRGQRRDSVNYAEVFKKAKNELARKKGFTL